MYALGWKSAKIATAAVTVLLFGRVGSAPQLQLPSDSPFVDLFELFQAVPSDPQGCSHQHGIDSCACLRGEADAVQAK